MPPENKIMLGYVCGFLRSVAQNSAKSKMNAENLGIIFGPNLLKNQTSDQNTLATNLPKQSIAIAGLITHYEIMFSGIDLHKVLSELNLKKDTSKDQLKINTELLNIKKDTVKDLKRTKSNREISDVKDFKLTSQGSESELEINKKLKKEIKHLKGKVERRDKEIEELKHAHNETAKQATVDHKIEITNLNENLVRSASEINKQDQATAQINTLQSENNNYKKDLENNKVQIQKLTEEKDKLVADNTIINNERNTLKQSLQDVQTKLQQELEHEKTRTSKIFNRS